MQYSLHFGYPYDHPEPLNGNLRIVFDPHPISPLCPAAGKSPELLALLELLRSHSAEAYVLTHSADCELSPSFDSVSAQLAFAAKIAPRVNELLQQHGHTYYTAVGAS